MKKFLALLLALVMVISITACGKTEPADSESDNPTQVEQPEIQEETPEVSEETPEDVKEEDKKPEELPEAKPEQKPEEKPEQKPAETPKTVGNDLLKIFKANANGSTQDIADSIIANANFPFPPVTEPVTPGLLMGFGNAEITGFKSATKFCPIIGSIAFMGYIFEVEDGVSTSDFIATLKKEGNLRWNICTEAEEMVTGAVGNKVFFVMCPKAFEEE